MRSVHRSPSSDVMSEIFLTWFSCMVHRLKDLSHNYYYQLEFKDVIKSWKDDREQFKCSCHIQLGPGLHSSISFNGLECDFKGGRFKRRCQFNLSLHKCCNLNSLILYFKIINTWWDSLVYYNFQNKYSFM